jgi:hypothetical protein
MGGANRFKDSRDSRDWRDRRGGRIGGCLRSAGANKVGQWHGLDPFRQRIAMAAGINHPTFIQFEIGEGNAQGRGHDRSGGALALNADAATVLEQQKVEVCP